MGWTMVVSSRQVVDGGWAGEARRLRSFLDVMSACLETQYDEPVVWSDEDLTAEQWFDLVEVTAEIERQQVRNPDGSIFSGGGSGSAVVARRGDAKRPIIGNRWSVGGDNAWQFNAAMTFYTGDFEAGAAKPLEDHPTDWLVHLLCAASASVEAAEGRIEPVELVDEIIDIRHDSCVGSFTLAPNGIGGAKLPSSITAYPCPVGFPDGLVLVADRDKVVNDPASLVDDLLVVDDILRNLNDSN